MAINVSELNTGKLTFEGVKIKGALGGSGDGLGSDTIELVPDVDLYTAHQYLVIDPTGPNHIHIRAGGVQDTSTADLFLGGERTGVQVSDATGDVNIRSKNPDQVNIYANSNGTSNTQFIHATGPDIIVGDTVQLYTGGDLFTVTSVTPDSPSVGFITVVADGLTFVTGESYNFYRSLGENIWQFNNDGTTSFPVILADLHNESAPVLAEVLQFSSTYQSVITNAVPAIGVDAQRIIIQGQRATGGGEGGDVYLWGGDAESNGGDIKIYAGDADDVGGGYGGYVNIQGGSGYDNGGDVTIRGGTSSSNTGGSVAIYGGTGDSYGQVTITNDTYTWTFDSLGNITIPNLKDVKDVAGNTAISGGNRVKTYSSSTGPTIPVDESNIYSINTTTQATTIKLPDTSTVPIGYNLMVFDNIGNAASKNITITADTIAGDSIISAPSGIAIDTNYGLLAFKHVGGKSWAILYGR